MLRELKDREKVKKTVDEQSQNINETENLKKKQILELKSIIIEKKFPKACLSKLEKKNQQT